MSDRYYLLRNNRETGPFPLGELLQQCLLPGDLVWVEGRSQYWHQPAEVPEIESALPKGYSLSPTEKLSSSVTEHISDREMALRAESIRRRALAALYHQVPLHQGTPRAEIPTGPVYLREEDAVEVVQYKPASTRNNIAEFMLFCTLSTLVVIGWRSGVFSHLVQVRPQVAGQATQLVSESANAATATAVPGQQPQQSGFLLPQPKAQPIALSNNSEHTDSSALAIHKSATHPRPAAPKRTAASDSDVLAVTPDPATANKGTEAAPASADPLREPVKTAVAPDKADKPANDVAEKAKPKETAVTPDNKSVADSEVKEEKKGFGLFRGLFKKKKREEAAAPASDN
ncbi:hypothetical protein EPD60_13760 [Flaviaesturariibacter flavus]|uniref:DUF4339 domain-containing protein n=1 Tax=Flaviaesturariibacter flavus TaxID=2502780 RepID=A0A4R1B679_9BACT|nr:DUF4339 domain-containing protein [Flaviaesturariibacter flavus]TCJ13130.1 hypothetical protein EPD60_13760 [Flaviaesturariibacter flavus]